MKREKGESEVGRLRSEKVKREKGESEPVGVCGSMKVRFRQAFHRVGGGWRIVISEMPLSLIE